MGEILDSFEFRGGVGGKKYDWDDLLDGRIHKLTSADVDCKLKTVAMMSRDRAKKRGLKVRVSLNEKEGFLVLQAFKPEQSEGQQEQQSEQEQTPEQKQPATETKGKGRKGRKQQ